MKIWISRDEEDDGGCEVHYKEPEYCKHSSAWGGTFYFAATSIISLPLCIKGHAALKKVLRLDDWPKVGEVMEYDTNTEQGLIWKGEIK